MIKIGIIGLGNVAWNVHLPILLSRDDIKISWICDQEIKKKKIFDKKKIPFFENINKAIQFEECDIALITVPYHQRKTVFDNIKKFTKGIYYEKPFALTIDEHKYFSEKFKNYEVTVGFQRRRMGVVKTIKSIIESNIFGSLLEINIDFGDIHYKFDSFRSDNKKSGGGIFFETGSHWIDTALYTSNAKEVYDFNCVKKIEDNLDIESEGKFKIFNEKNIEIKCNFFITTLKNTNNKITYLFENCSIDLFLFDNESNLVLNNSDSDKFIIQKDEYLNLPNLSLGVGASYWNDYLKCFINKKDSDLSVNNYILTTKIIELFYEK
ncbi:MAG: hypothetical protein CMN00_06135 [Rickettsiales bacterium]|nr:hypothetical protein [Rickettsiales bacterium]|tara:strand:+ start:1723 stop:2691 length:969 start_codon:yes stop_codon:yes gene_type:complete